MLISEEKLKIHTEGSKHKGETFFGWEVSWRLSLLEDLSWQVWVWKCSTRFGWLKELEILGRLGDWEQCIKLLLCITSTHDLLIVEHLNRAWVVFGDAHDELVKDGAGRKQFEPSNDLIQLGFSYLWWLRAFAEAWFNVTARESYGRKGIWPLLHIITLARQSLRW
jgi:hypothetical protein